MINSSKFGSLRNCSIAVMPDFFIDRIVRLKSPTKDVFKLIQEKEKFGGGSIRDMSSLDTRGGNAVNIAYCLAKLGVHVTLFTIANEIGEAVLRKIFSKFDDDTVDLQIANGKHGHTTALEFVGEFGSKVNIMLNDVGDIAYFGPERIDHEHGKQILKNADAVIVVNWGSNLRGSELVEYAFEQSPNSYHCIDPADMDARRFEFKDTLTRISNITSSLNINENECNSLLNALSLDSHKISELKFQDSDSENVIKKAALEIANKLNIKSNIHTRIGAAWSDGEETFFVPSFKVEPRTLTGAGDSWDSANIIAHVAGLDKEQCLILSNAYAALYVANPISEPATLDETIDFIDKNGD